MQDTDRSGTVLVVDDEPDLADLYEIWLSPQYDVRTAYGGQQALDELDQAVDVALLDRRMPGRSGEEVAERIVQIAPETAIAFVSSEADPTVRSGVQYDAYLTKPVDRSALLELVAALLDPPDERVPVPGAPGESRRGPASSPDRW
ncbi:MAG: response regulator [Haloferacaceae archaeon]